MKNPCANTDNPFIKNRANNTFFLIFLRNVLLLKSQILLHQYDEFIVKFIVEPNYKLKDNVLTNMLKTAGRIVDKSSVLKNAEYDKIEKAGK